jgi:hypothetical protein
VVFQKKNASADFPRFSPDFPKFQTDYEIIFVNPREYFHTNTQLFLADFPGFSGIFHHFPPP